MCMLTQHVSQDYRNAARNCLLAGFDGIEIGAAYGFLLDQFLQSKTNVRTDEYGGTMEKRFKFVGEVIDVIVDVCSPSPCTFVACLSFLLTCAGVRPRPCWHPLLAQLTSG